MDKYKILFGTALTCMYLALSGCASAPPSTLGLHEQYGLYPCPPKPNCVSSFAKDAEHYIAPFPIKQNDALIFNRLIKLLDHNPLVHIIRVDSNYLRAEFHSRFWGFVDDVEFLMKGNQIHARSASRLGYSDFGVNRKRINQLWQNLKNSDISN